MAEVTTESAQTSEAPQKKPKAYNRRKGTGTAEETFGWVAAQFHRLPILESIPLPLPGENETEREKNQAEYDAKIAARQTVLSDLYKKAPDREAYNLLVHCSETTKARDDFWRRRMQDRPKAEKGGALEQRDDDRKILRVIETCETWLESESAPHAERTGHSVARASSAAPRQARSVGGPRSPQVRSVEPVGSAEGP